MNPTTTKKKKAKKAKQPPSIRPWKCVVLAVDTATRSGWSIAVCGKYDRSGEVHTRDVAELGRVVGEAQQLAANLEVPLVLVLEKPFGGHAITVATLGEARGTWKSAWRSAGLSDGKVTMVMPQTWRASVLGPGINRAGREIIRARELQLAAAIAERVVGPDEAPAVLIARWASHSAIVGKLIGLRARAASMVSWRAVEKQEPAQ